MDLMSKTLKDNIISGFRKCGIFPFNRDAVLCRLPDQIGNITEGVSNAVLQKLAAIHKSLQEPSIRVKKKRINVAPGKSVSLQDFQERRIAGPYGDAVPGGDVGRSGDASASGGTGLSFLAGGPRGDYSQTSRAFVGVNGTPETAKDLEHTAAPPKSSRSRKRRMSSLNKKEKVLKRIKVSLGNAPPKVLQSEASVDARAIGGTGPSGDYAPKYTYVDLVPRWKLRNL